MNAVARAALVSIVISSSPAFAQTPAAVTAADLAGAWVGDLDPRGRDDSLRPGARARRRRQGPREDVAADRPHQPSAHRQDAARGLGHGGQARAPRLHLRRGRAHPERARCPTALVPVYTHPARPCGTSTASTCPRAPELAAPLAAPVWTFDAGAPLWPGATFAGGTVYAGGEDGGLHALDAEDGQGALGLPGGRRDPDARARSRGRRRSTSRPTTGSSTSSPRPAGKERLAGAGRDQKPIERLPFDNPKSRYDRFGSDVTVAGGRLYLGTHDGRVLALDPATRRDALGASRRATASSRRRPSRRAASTSAATTATSTPSTRRGPARSGSTTRRAPWSRRPRSIRRAAASSSAAAATTSSASTPRPARPPGSTTSGPPGSSRRRPLRDGVAYVGSSDAAALYAFDARTGRARCGRPTCTAGPGASPRSRTPRLHRHRGHQGLPRRPSRGRRGRGPRHGPAGRGASWPRPSDVGLLRLPGHARGGRRARVPDRPRRPGVRLRRSSPAPCGYNPPTSPRFAPRRRTGGRRCAGRTRPRGAAS